MAFVFYNFFFKSLVNLKLSFIGKKFYTFFNRKWFFDKIYNELLAQHTLTIAYEHGYQNMDRGIIELVGPSGIWQLFSPISNNLNYAFNFHLDTPKKLRSFFKILFITFIFIYFLLFGVWYINAYETYIELFFGKYFEQTLQHTAFDFYPNNFSDYWTITDFVKSRSYVHPSANFPLEPGQGKLMSLLHIQGLIQCLSILKTPFDVDFTLTPYLPYSERWIPNLEQFVKDAILMSQWDGKSFGFPFGG